MTPATTPPDSLYQLVDKFERGRAQFTQPDYNEAQLRQEFVNPFFAALGWDVGDSHQVLHEAGLKSGGSTKHPDYSFLAGRRRAFYVETKKPAINISQQIEPAGQLRSYGWSGNTAVGILTNFAEFAVYDCRIPPEQGDPAAAARVWHLTSAQYPASWTRLRETLSPLAVRQGKHKDLLADVGKGALPVDAAFLRDMENWRKTLAEQLYKQARFIDRELSQRELNLLVQRTIDRIVFLRIAEDRSLEPYGALERVAREKQIYEKIKNLYRAADKKYNSGLFHFDASDKTRGAPDNLSMDIYIPDNVLQKIIFALYPPQSRYEFSVIAADILGQVYERFLGKVIEVRSDGIETSVAVEEKPEVRKAGGVYYTPTYIVETIVENTLGKLLEGKNPDQAAELRVLDPACGSGSFLTGAYQYLLDWHIDYYRRHPAQFRNRRRETAQGMLLTTTEKRRILLNNIYGVDLDQSAVEVSKLSLLLKMLENENDSTGMRELDGPMLPDLGGNIKWGNSLVGSDFYADSAWANADEEELLRVKAFDWDSERGFGSIMAAGGFDAVIGNPPYGAWFDSTQAGYFTDKYSVFKGVKDIYVAFIEQAAKLTRSQGKVSFIVPSAWTGGPRYRRLRDFLLQFRMDNVILLPFDVFADAYVDTLVFALDKAAWPNDHRVSTYVYGKKDKVERISLAKEDWDTVPQSAWQDIDNHKFVLDSGTIKIISKIADTCNRQFSDIADIKRGVLFKRDLLTTSKSSLLSHPYFEGDVNRYRINYRADNWIEFDDQMTERPKEFRWFEGSRILLRRLVNRQQRLMGMLVSDTFITNKNLYSIVPKGSSSLPMMLGLLNSRFFSYLYLKQVTQATKDDFPQVTIRDMKSLPLPAMTLLENHEEHMVALVESMLDMHRQLPGLNDEARRVVELRIEATDRAIDALVYRLYGLSDDEVRVVEGG